MPQTPKSSEPIIVDVQDIGPVSFPAGTTGAQIETWVQRELRKTATPKKTVPYSQWRRVLGNTALRVGGGILGGVAGSLAGPVGTFAGAATGAALGEELAQRREVEQGTRAAVNPLSIAAAGATSAIPGATMKAGAPLLRQLPRAFAAGVPASAATSAAMQMAETGRVDPWQVGKDTLQGATLGSMVGLGAHGVVRGAQSKAVQKLLRDETGAIRAFHGSPHDFDQFSTEKIGTGEGAQVYGHGLYAADHPDVARGYRDIVPVAGKAAGEPLDTNMRVGRELVTDMYRRLDLQAARLPHKAAEPIYDRMSALETLMQHGDMLGVEEAAKAGQISREALAWMRKEVAPKFKRTGKLYEVDIDADPEQLLDWDAPIDRQPQAVIDLIRERLKAEGYLRQNDNGPRQLRSALASWRMEHGGMAETGMEALVGGRGKLVGGTPEEVSTALREAGVPGIRYLDQGSRDAGEGTSNYVVFDAKRIAILRKYGLLPFVGVSQLDRPQQDEKKKK